MDHRTVGTEQELFFFHELSPGSAFFLPAGARIYSALQAMIRAEYRRRGYVEVITPNMFNVQLWKTSGHYQHYREHMFEFQVDEQQFALKPMNCPGHCVLYAARAHSYRELPIRMCEFGVLHRNEFSGALGGLTRVRRFVQDDAHIFCRLDQVRGEIRGCLDFLNAVYGRFGFQFELELSTRPEKSMGDTATWDLAESQLREVLDEFGRPWKVNPGDGAFYGPKIDIGVYDARKRLHQCATIQLDFQLPEKFDLEFKSSNPDKDYERPVMIHRAILGSIERMIAILCEHWGGKWPLWLSPRQVCIVPIDASCEPFCDEVRKKLQDFYVDVDYSSDKFNKKIRDAQIAQYNYILVVGRKEVQNGTVNVRTRDNVTHGEKSVDELIQMLNEEMRN